MEEANGRSGGVKISSILHGKVPSSWGTEVGWGWVVVCQNSPGSVESGDGGGRGRGGPTMEEEECRLVPELMVEDLSSKGGGINSLPPRCDGSVASQTSCSEEVVMKSGVEVVGEPIPSCSCCGLCHPGFFLTEVTMMAEDLLTAVSDPGLDIAPVEGRGVSGEGRAMGSNGSSKLLDALWDVEEREREGENTSAVRDGGKRGFKREADGTVVGSYAAVGEDAATEGGEGG